jgi:hypothetical protein
VNTEKTLPLYESFEEMSFALADFFGRLEDLDLGALVFFIGAAIKLRYHPASRRMRGASKGMHGKVRERWLARKGRSPRRTN